MHRQRKLSALLADLQLRTSRLDALDSQIFMQPTPYARRTASYMTLELLTAWSSFSREFYLSSAYCATKTVGGTRVHHATPGVVDKRSALILAIRTLRNPNYSIPPHKPISPRDEPDWKAKGTLLSLSAAIGFSNAPAILSGLSYPATFFDELAVFRNFFAHRDEGTAGRVARLAKARYQVHSFGHPAELLLRPLPNRPGRLFLTWSSEVKTVAALMCA